MAEGLVLDNILDDVSMDLFDTGKGQQEDTTTEVDGSDESGNDVNEQEDTAEVDTDLLFGEPESVGGEGEEKEGSPSDEGGDSPNSKFFSSVAKTFADEGILPNLDDETIDGIKTPEDFRKAIEEAIKSEMTEQQQRVKEALDNNMEVDTVRNFEIVLGNLNRVTEDTLSSETEAAEKTRKQLLYQDYLNRGFSQKRATREVERSFSNGTDIEDAREALQSLKDFYQRNYSYALEQARMAQEEERQELQKKAVTLKNRIFDEKSKFFGEVSLDKGTRQKVYDNITKPIWKDKETGETLTAIQLYEKEHSEDFLAQVGLLYTLTDGFKNLDKLVSGKVKKEVRSSLRDLENKINNSSRDAYGNLKFASDTGDSEAYIGKGLKLAL